MEGHLKPQRCADATIKGKLRNKILMMMLVQKAKKNSRIAKTEQIDGENVVCFRENRNIVSEVSG